MDAWEPHHLLWSCAATAFSVAGGSPASATDPGYRTVAGACEIRVRPRRSALPRVVARAGAATRAASPAAHRRRGRTPRRPDRPPVPPADQIVLGPIDLPDHQRTQAHHREVAQQHRRGEPLLAAARDRARCRGSTSAAPTPARRSSSTPTGSAGAAAPAPPAAPATARTAGSTPCWSAGTPPPPGTPAAPPVAGAERSARCNRLRHNTTRTAPARPSFRCCRRLPETEVRRSPASR